MGYLPELAKPIFIADNPEDKEAERWYFERAGINLNYIGGSQYLGAYLGPREDTEVWVYPKVEAWDHRSASKLK